MISRTPQAAIVSIHEKNPAGKGKGVLSPSATDVDCRLWPGLLLLLQAYDYAEDTRSDYWDFAVEISDLRRHGMTLTDCRWFIRKGWAQQARELSPRQGEPRRFQKDLGLTLRRCSCLVLLPAGEALARQIAAQKKDNARVESDVRVMPHWDRDRHELRLGSMTIKQFKLPSPNQEMILMALEEESWPPRIDDPLPPSKNIDAKQRLHDTIKNLNRNQKQRLVRFMGDGTGQGVRWELIVEKPTPGSDLSVRPTKVAANMVSAEAG